MNPVRSLPRWSMSCLALLTVLVSGGCDELTGPVRIETTPNAFKLCDARRNETIVAVTVYDDTRNCVWEIRAVEEVSAKGFIVTVGKLPAGFTQFVPSPPRVFDPVAGCHYWIEIDANLSRAVHSIPLEWVAD